MRGQLLRGLDFKRTKSGIWTPSGLYTSAIAEYLFSENFEGTGYENAGWVETPGSGTINEDYTTSPAPLEGTQSLYMTTAAAETINVKKDNAYSGQAQVWYFFKFRLTALEAGTGNIFGIRNTAGSGILYLYRPISGVLQIDCGTGITQGTATVTTGYTYSIWIRYKKGTGSNAEYDLYIATDSETKPGTPDINGTNGTSTTDAGGHSFYCGQNQVIIFDKLRAKASVIGSNPT